METNFFKTKLKIIFSSLIVAVVLFLAISKGISAGKETAQAESLIRSSRNLVAGLQYFYNDQNRFPTALEFSSRDIMLNYFSAFPPADFPSAVCAQSFLYKQTGANNFNLSFCLPRSADKFNSGWNVINGQK